MLPGLDGYEVLRTIRTFSDIPVLMLSVHGEEHDKVRGFKLGVDDFMVKPFSPRELMYRVAAILKRRPAQRLPYPGRRRTGGGSGGPRVSVDGRPVELSPKEFDLLLQLVSHPAPPCPGSFCWRRCGAPTAPKESAPWTPTLSRFAVLSAPMPAVSYAPWLVTDLMRPAVSLSWTGKPSACGNRQADFSPAVFRRRMDAAGYRCSWPQKRSLFYKTLKISYWISTALPFRIYYQTASPGFQSSLRPPGSLVRRLKK